MMLQLRHRIITLFLLFIRDFPKQLNWCHNNQAQTNLQCLWPALWASEDSNPTTGPNSSALQKKDGNFWCFLKILRNGWVFCGTLPVFLGYAFKSVSLRNCQMDRFSPKFLRSLQNHRVPIICQQSHLETLDVLIQWTVSSRTWAVHFVHQIPTTSSSWFKFAFNCVAWISWFLLSYCLHFPLVLGESSNQKIYKRYKHVDTIQPNSKQIIYKRECIYYIKYQPWWKKSQGQPPNIYVSPLFHPINNGINYHINGFSRRISPPARSPPAALPWAPRGSAGRVTWIAPPINGWK